MIDPAGQQPRPGDAVQRLAVALARQGACAEQHRLRRPLPATICNGPTSLIGVELNYSHGMLRRPRAPARRSAAPLRPTTVTTDVIGVAERLDARDRFRFASRPRRLCGRQLPALRVRRRRAWGRPISTAASNSLSAYNVAGRAFHCSPARMLLTDNANSHFVTGFAAGLGFDMMLYARPFHARRVGISPLHLQCRYQRQHGARGPRLQVLMPRSTAASG